MSAKNKNPNRPYTSHEQSPEKKERGQERDSRNQHKNPTHETDPSSKQDNTPRKEEEEEE